MCFVIHGCSSVSLPDADKVLYLFVMPITCSVGINNLDGAPVHFNKKGTDIANGDLHLVSLNYNALWS